MDCVSEANYCTISNTLLLCFGFDWCPCRSNPTPPATASQYFDNGETPYVPSRYACCLIFVCIVRLARVQRYVCVLFLRSATFVLLQTTCLSLLVCFVVNCDGTPIFYRKTARIVEESVTARTRSHLGVRVGSAYPELRSRHPRPWVWKRARTIIPNNFGK